MEDDMTSKLFSFWLKDELMSAEQVKPEDRISQGFYDGRTTALRGVLNAFNKDAEIARCDECKREHNLRRHT